MFTLVGTLLCLGKQIFAFKTEKKRYEQLIRDNQNSSGENAVPTERALITGTGETETVSPKKVVSTDMPALQTQQSDLDEDSVADEQKAHIKFSNKADNDDLMQIEDQNEHKKGSVPTTIKAHDVSSIIDRFDSVDNGDKTLQQVHGMFDQSKNVTPTMSRLRQTSQQTSDLRLEEDLDSSNKAANVPKESAKHKRIQSAVTTTGLMSNGAEDLAEDVNQKVRAVAQTPEGESSEYDSSLQQKSSKKTTSKKSKAVVEDLIQDIYSEENLEDYDSPEQ